MTQLDWHRVRMELTAPQQNEAATAGSTKAEPGDPRSIPDGNSTEALLAHIALALADQNDPSR